MKRVVINIRASKNISGLVKDSVTSPPGLMKIFLNVEPCKSFFTTLDLKASVFSEKQTKLEGTYFLRDEKKSFFHGKKHLSEETANSGNANISARVICMYDIPACPIASHK